MSLRLHGVQVTDRGRLLVDVDELRLPRGRAVAIVGESGSGKSLLAHTIMGTLPAELDVTGDLSLGTERYDLAQRANRRRLWGEVLALLPQEPSLALDPTMRVEAQVAEGVRGERAGWAGRRASRQRAHEALEAVGVADAARVYPHVLSGGMAQRVAFAAATIGGAPVLIADEPSKGLDDAACDELAGLLEQHVSAGGVLLVVTHDLGLARRLDGEVLVMKEATIVEDGAARQVLDAPEHEYTRRLVAAEPEHWSQPWMRQRYVTQEGQRPLVTAEGIAKSFGAHELFSGLSITLHAGERLALAGSSGVGKTTLGNILARLLPPDAGRVEHDPSLRDGGVQKLYQDPASAFPSKVSLGAAFGDVLRRHELERDRLDALLSAFRLDPSLLERRPGQVSGGELQRLAIARAMLVDPVLVFADEPTSRLDLVSQQETMHHLMSQVDAQGCSLLLVTHDHALADAVADRRLWLGDEALQGEVTGAA